jgi:hypothetical protein
MKKLALSLICASLATTGFAAHVTSSSNDTIIFNMSQKVMSVDYQICKTVGDEQPFTCGGTTTVDILATPGSNFTTIPVPSSDYSVSVIQAVMKDGSAKTIFSQLGVGVSSCTGGGNLPLSLNDMNGTKYITCSALDM